MENLIEEFKLNEYNFIELNNLLKIMGICESGGRAKTLIAEGQVKVDGKVELRKRCKIRSGQVVECDSRKVIVN